jgi:spermidine synthase
VTSGADRLALLAVVALAGGVLMALEMVSFRVLSPTFGNSVYVWGSIISVFLAAMSAGYVLGGRLADHRPSLAVLGQLLLLAAVAQAALVVGSLGTAAELARRLDYRPWAPLVVTTILFGPATALLATVSPFVVRVVTQDVAALGRVAGRLYAVSTAGSLAGTLGCTFLLIPYFELSPIVFLLVALTVVSGLLALGRRALRQPAALALAALALAWTWWGARWIEVADPALKARRLSAYQTIEVREHSGQRELIGNGERQSAIELETGLPALRYARMVVGARLFVEQPERALVLGLGAGNVASYLHRELPDLLIDNVEIDPEIVEVAREHFALVTSERNRVHVSDARAFLRGHEGERWDLIYIDTYYGLSIPFHLATLEMYEQTRHHLAPEHGILMLNLAAPASHPFVRAVLATISQVYPQTYVFPVAGASGVMVVATQSPLRLAREELLARAAGLDAGSSLEPTYQQIAGQLRAVEIDVSQTEILRDAFAPVDRLLHLGRR